MIRNVIKIALGFISIVFILTMAGRYSINQANTSNDIPEEIVSWAQNNVWKITHLKTLGSGSGFWIDDHTMITACHVVKTAKVVMGRDAFNKHSVELSVRSCDEEKDIAILDLYNAREPVVIHHSKVKLWTKGVKQGKVLYGPGYPLGERLTITWGHQQLSVTIPETDIVVNNVTTTTIMGDSGSPVLLYRNGVVYVVGIRIQIRGLNMGYGATDFITHLTRIVTPQNLEEALILTDR